MSDDTMPAGPEDDLEDDLGVDADLGDEDFDDEDFGDDEDEDEDFDDEDDELPSIVIETPNGSVVSVW